MRKGGNIAPFGVQDGIHRGPHPRYTTISPVTTTPPTFHTNLTTTSPTSPVTSPSSSPFLSRSPMALGRSLFSPPAEHSFPVRPPCAIPLPCPVEPLPLYFLTKGVLHFLAAEPLEHRPGRRSMVRAVSRAGGICDIRAPHAMCMQGIGQDTSSLQLRI